MTAPTDEEFAAIEQRYRDTQARSLELEQASLKASAEWQAAGREYLRAHALRRDLREMLLDALTRYEWKRPGATVKALAKHTYRSEAVVQGVLDVLIEAGLVCKVGKAYEAAA